MLDGKTLYKRLSPYLGIKRAGITLNKLHRHWRKLPVHDRGVIDKKTGLYHAVMWMPKLRRGWRRLKYNEFNAYYGR